jgi:hypothetical protein
MILNRILDEREGNVFLDESFRRKIIPIMLSLATKERAEEHHGASGIIHESIRLGLCNWFMERKILPTDSELTNAKSVVLTFTDVKGLSEVLTKYSNR